MGARFDDAALFHDVNDVREPGCRKAVSNNNGRASLGQFLEAPERIRLGPRVHGAGGLVQDDYLGSTIERSGQGDALPLTNTELGAPLKPVTQHVLVALRQAGDDLVGSGPPGLLARRRDCYSGRSIR